VIWTSYFEAIWGIVGSPLMASNATAAFCWDVKCFFMVVVAGKEKNESIE